MGSPERHALIVGAGVVGAFCAYFLRRDGWRVTLVDRGTVGGACSHGNCGYVSPSHVLPLCRPGQLRNGLIGLVSRDQALSIRPQLRPAFWGWLLRFARHCNHADALRGGAARHALLASSAALYREVLARHALEVEWNDQGLLFVFKERAGFEAYRATDRLLGERFDVRAEPIEGGAALAAFEPALKPDLAGAWLYRIDAALRPDRLMTGLRRVLEAEDVVIRERCEVTGLLADGGRVRGAATADGPLEADVVVACTGAWTPRLNALLGCRVPIEPVKGTSITMPRPERCPRHPMVLEEPHVAITPFASGYRIGSTMDFVGYDATLEPRRLAYLRRHAAAYLHEPLADPVEEEWCGWRPMTPDDLPILDRTPRFENVWIAAGHGMLGISTAPATGRLLAERLGGRAPHIAPEPFALRR
jgi:D-amino-acid dehydrogenase